MLILQFYEIRNFETDLGTLQIVCRWLCITSDVASKEEEYEAQNYLFQQTDHEAGTSIFHGFWLR